MYKKFLLLGLVIAVLMSACYFQADANSDQVFVALDGQVIYFLPTGTDLNMLFGSDKIFLPQ